MRVFKAALCFFSVACVCFLLCSCTRVVRSEKDEITMFSWYSELDNGNKLSLSFGEDEALFNAENDGFSMEISGYYLIDDERFVIFDEDTKMDYTFIYKLHGDRVELSFGDGTITLDKRKDD